MGIRLSFLAKIEPNPRAMAPRKRRISLTLRLSQNVVSENRMPGVHCTTRRQHLDESPTRVLIKVRTAESSGWGFI